MQTMTLSFNDNGVESESDVREFVNYDYTGAYRVPVEGERYTDGVHGVKFAGPINDGESYHILKRKRRDECVRTCDHEWGNDHD